MPERIERIGDEQVPADLNLDVSPGPGCQLYDGTVHEVKMSVPSTAVLLRVVRN
jgi:hypothetical protein